MTSAAPPIAWTIGSVVKWATDDFRARCIENPRLDAELLVAFALGIDRMRVIIDAERPLDRRELALLRDLVRRRRAHEPLAYLRGEREFYGLHFRVDKRVLVPRPDTETLVDVGLRRTAHVSLSMRQLDLCTGSGCVAIAMAHRRPSANVLAVDVSADALDVARDNAHRLGVYNVGFFEGDLFAPTPSCSFDLVTANPPYIPTGEIDSLMSDVKDFEPRIALDGGRDGLELIRRIVADAPAHLVRGGVLAMEIGAGEAGAVAALFAERGFRDIKTDRDFAKIERVVSAVWEPR
ncbi:MAG: peptide chain release factor N(5)-glutamine methyltransferase [Polyangiaceae bacterium]|nr:peptide chain release factor N(5)-glutamine methyltransferase [Polyangiaceae bacterium]